MNSSKWLSAGVASVVGLAFLFATVQAAAATELNSQQRSQQQIQQQTDKPATSIPSQPNQLKQPGSAGQKKMHQKQYQYRYEKNLNKSEKGNRATGVPGSRDRGNRSTQGVGRSGNR